MWAHYENEEYCSKLKSLEIEIFESFLVHFILNSLPLEYGPFKISYNAHKDKWSINELLTMCVQEEERLKHEAPKSTHMVTHNKGNGRRGNGVPGVRKTVQMKRNGQRWIAFSVRRWDIWIRIISNTRNGSKRNWIKF